MRVLIIIGGLICWPSIAFANTECQSRWLAAEKAKIVYGHRIVQGVPTIVVDEIVFRNVDFTVKLGLVSTYSCAIAGAGNHLREVAVVSNKTNKRLGRWTPSGGLKVD